MFELGLLFEQGTIQGSRSQQRLFTYADFKGTVTRTACLMKVKVLEVGHIKNKLGLILVRKPNKYKQNCRVWAL